MRLTRATSRPYETHCAAGGERFQVARGKRRRVERGYLAHAHRLAVEVCSEAAFGVRELAVDGRARDSEHDLSAGA